MSIVNKMCQIFFNLVRLQPTIADQHFPIFTLKKMKRTMVIGCCGAGKSTFSRKLHAITGTELIHLDQHFWKPDWVETEKDVWAEKVRDLADKPEWIIDGNYGGTMDIRLQRADTIIFLDYPTWKCLWRITKRILKDYGRSRPDMPEGCKERINWPFYRYVATYNVRKRPQILQKLAALPAETRVIIFTNDQAATEFLKSLSG